MPITPNIGIYVPVAGETNYQDSFMAGMVNIDQHDHSGGPTGGVPIASSGIADGSITYQKLNTNVADTTTGIGTHVGPFANQLYLMGNLASIYQLNIPTPVAGLLSINGNAASALTLTGTANQIAITNPQGIAGNPTFSLPSTIYTNISFDSGVHTLNSYTSGTFTPTLNFGGSNTGITYSTQIGKYWKIGSVVYCNIEFVLTSKGSQTGNASVGGLPFTSANDGHSMTFATEAFLGTYPSGTTYIISETLANTTSIFLAACGAGNQTAVTDANFTNTSLVSMSGFYWTT